MRRISRSSVSRSVFLLVPAILLMLLFSPTVRAGVIYCDEDFEGAEIFADRDWPHVGNDPEPQPGALLVGLNLRRWSQMQRTTEEKTEIGIQEGVLDASRSFRGSQSYRLDPGRTLAVTPGAFQQRSEKGTRFWQFALSADATSATLSPGAVLGSFTIGFVTKDPESLDADTTVTLDLRLRDAESAELVCANNDEVLGEIGFGPEEWLLVSILALNRVNAGSQTDTMSHWMTPDPFTETWKGPTAGVSTGIHIHVQNNRTGQAARASLRRGQELPIEWAAAALRVQLEEGQPGADVHRSWEAQESTAEVGWRFTAREGSLFIDNLYWEARTHQYPNGGFDRERGARIEPFASGVSLAPLFSHNMVLQRGTSVPVYGSDRPGQSVRVEIADQIRTTVADPSGRWTVRLDPMVGSGPFDMTVIGSSTEVIRNVMFGEVWVLSGQSNMHFLMKQTRDSEELAAADIPSLRLFTTPGWMNSHPSEYPVGSWEPCTPESAAEFSAVGYYFARDLMNGLEEDVAVGLIHASLGGTRAGTWISLPALHAEFGMDSDLLKPSWNGAFPLGSLYNGMIAPLTRYAIRGVNWYQGESNADMGHVYRRVLSTLIRDWRAQWNQGDFPFQIVQLPEMEGDWGGGPWPILREAQLQVAQSLPNTSMVVTFDVGDAKDVHPRDKESVGHRLALAALARVYGREIPYSGPVYTRHIRIENGLRLYFDHADGGLVDINGEDLLGFEIAGADGIYHPAHAVIEGNSVILTSEAVPEPIHTRYAWDNVPPVELFNGAGLPASSFRTDPPEIPED